VRASGSGLLLSPVSLCLPLSPANCLVSVSLRNPGSTPFYFVGGRKMGSISLSSWLKAAENEFCSIPLVAENEENISLNMAEDCGERICLASVPGENFSCERPVVSHWYFYLFDRFCESHDLVVSPDVCTWGAFFLETMVCHWFF
jgi:hypothetical protein